MIGNIFLLKLMEKIQYTKSEIKRIFMIKGIKHGRKAHYLNYLYRMLNKIRGGKSGSHN